MARLLLSLSVLLATTLGCATAPSPFERVPENPWEGRAGMDLTVRVENNHYESVSVTAVWEKLEYYLGEVPPNSSERFSIPGNLLENHGGPRFLADPIGSAQQELTPPVHCVKARTVEWRLKRNLHPSRPIVY